MIIGTLGGIIIPMVEEATVMPLANSAVYPFFFISGISTAPIEAVSDTDDPEIPPNIMLANTFTAPRPPRNLPTKSRLKSISRVVIPPAFIKSPMRTNRGKAIIA